MGYFQILGKCHICYKFIERMIDALSTIYLLQICGKMIEDSIFYLQLFNFVPQK